MANFVNEKTDKQTELAQLVRQVLHAASRARFGVGVLPTATLYILPFITLVTSKAC